MLEKRKNVVTSHADTDNDSWSHVEKMVQGRIEGFGYQFPFPYLRIGGQRTAFDSRTTTFRGHVNPESSCLNCRQFLCSEYATHCSRANWKKARFLAYMAECLSLRLPDSGHRCHHPAVR